VGRADNVLPGGNKYEHLQILRQNIRDFKAKNNLNKVIVLWTANTERFCKETPELHGSIDTLM
jgi:myo-inositol-1-phosphate synthase